MGRVFACSDLHGQYDLFLKLKEMMTNEDRCYVLGDCVDRGPGSIKILLDIIHDKRFTMLKGNHEQMMFEAISQLEEGYSDDIYLWYMNGGQETHEEFMLLDRQMQIEVLHFIKKLPPLINYNGLILTHAGFDWALDEVDEEVLLWDRSHITSSTPAPSKVVQVHGHTPSRVMTKDKRDAITKYPNSKITIDCGTCVSGILGVLDLDTLDSFYITR